MSIKSFKNQGSFTGVLEVDTFGVSTFSNGLDATQQKSALLFDGDADKEVDVEVPASVVFDGATYTFDIDKVMMVKYLQLLIKIGYQFNLHLILPRKFKHQQLQVMIV